MFGWQWDCRGTGEEVLGIGGTPCHTSIPLTLHVGEGLRPMLRDKKGSAYVQAQRITFLIS